VPEVPEAAAMPFAVACRQNTVGGFGRLRDITETADRIQIAVLLRKVIA
jgi:predicted small secreted protein